MNPCGILDNYKDACHCHCYVWVHIYCGWPIETSPCWDYLRAEHPVVLKCWLFPYYSSILREHVLLRQSCQQQNYHLKMLSHILGYSMLCHVQGQIVMNQCIELESLGLNRISSLAVHYLKQKFRRNRISTQTQRLLYRHNAGTDMYRIGAL